ncbi:MAG: 1-acyl-sn-glycerol-3-phosphate acyltransferase [Gammaproteobacteria bacterium]|nr:1-acyl-sn-glycerol-3-phosphate acyltransferase [Gammaproteobacteria bacterium]
MRRGIYSLYCGVVFVGLGLATLVINVFVRDDHARRRVAGGSARAFLKAARIPFSVEGLERLPGEACVVVANHASYLDGIVAIAALPPHFAFVIKREMVQVPLAGFLLRRLGSEFVERFDPRRGAADARRVVKRATRGQSLVFFPEGTFTEIRQVGQFLRGAFTTAARAGMPIVAVAIHGTREVLPSGSALLRRRPIRVEVLEVLRGEDARDRSRELIAAAIGEPLA